MLKQLDIPVMQVNTTPVEAPLGKPSITDYAVLITSVIPESVFTLIPLSELERRCNEVARTQKRFREETPVLLAIETKRRAALAGPHLFPTPPYDSPTSCSNPLSETTRA